MTPHEQQVVDFFAQWSESFEAMCDSFVELLAEDCAGINARFLGSPDQAGRCAFSRSRAAPWD